MNDIKIKEEEYNIITSEREQEFMKNITASYRTVLKDTHEFQIRSPHPPDLMDIWRSSSLVDTFLLSFIDRIKNNEEEGTERNDDYLLTEDPSIDERASQWMCETQIIEYLQDIQTALFKMRMVHKLSGQVNGEKDIFYLLPIREVW